MYRAAIEQQNINMDLIRELSHQGIPDELRSLYWKVWNKKLLQLIPEVVASLSSTQ